MTQPIDVKPTIRGVISDVAERAIKSAAQTLLLLFGADRFNLLNVDWKQDLGFAGGAALLSILTSLASLRIGNGGTASLTSAVVPATALDPGQYGRHAAIPLAYDLIAHDRAAQPLSSMTIADAPNVPQRRLGRLPNDPSKPRVRLTALEAPSLTYTPPASIDWHTNVPADSWGMDGNDGAGDCTFAELDHTVKADQVAAGNPEVKSTAAEVLAAYSAVTGYDPSQTDAQGNNPTDQGAMMQDVRNYWRKHGITLGGTKHTILLFAEVDHTNHGLIKWCIARFGALGIGFNFPASAMAQFDAGQPWTVVAGSPIDGGHAVSAVGYDADYLYVVTWGRVQKMTWAFYDKYVDEAWTQLSEEFVSQTSGNDPLAETAHQLGEQYATVTGQPNPIPAPSPAPTPTPQPGPVVLPADVIAWAKHVLTLKGQTHATIAVAKELLAMAGE